MHGYKQYGPLTIRPPINLPEELAHEDEDLRALVRQHPLGLAQRRLHALHAAQGVEVRLLGTIRVET